MAREPTGVGAAVARVDRRYESENFKMVGNNCVETGAA
jgi:hypothetical protein